jgi:hypothetical protein
MYCQEYTLDIYPQDHTPQFWLLPYGITAIMTGIHQTRQTSVAVAVE